MTQMPLHNNEERRMPRGQYSNFFPNSLGPNGIHPLLWNAANRDLEVAPIVDANSTSVGNVPVNDPSQQAW